MQSELIKRVIFVCMGNICRSPLAEAVARREFQRAGLEIEVASAGTIGFHEGDLADAGALDIARLNHIDLDSHRARQVRSQDFDAFDLVVALDLRNEADLRRVSSPRQHSKICRLLDFAPNCGHREVPDPYQRGRPAFAQSLDLIERGIKGLTRHLAAQSGPRGQSLHSEAGP